MSKESKSYIRIKNKIKMNAIRITGPDGNRRFSNKKSHFYGVFTVGNDFRVKPVTPEDVAMTIYSFIHGCTIVNFFLNGDIATDPTNPKTTIDDFCVINVYRKCSCDNEFTFEIISKDEDLNTILYKEIDLTDPRNFPVRIYDTHLNKALSKFLSE